MAQSEGKLDGAANIRGVTRGGSEFLWRLVVIIDLPEIRNRFSALNSEYENGICQGV